MRNHICLIILYTFTCILYSCSIEKEYNSFNIIYCKELHSGLQYCNSCKTIEYGEKKYAIEMCVYYVKNKLQHVDVYKCDGIISYTGSEVKSDKKLANYIGVPFVRNIIIDKDKLIDGNKISPYEAKGDSMIVNQAENIVIYVRQ